MFNWQRFVGKVGVYYPKLSTEAKKQVHEIVDMMEQTHDRKKLKEWARAVFKVIQNDLGGEKK